MTLGMYAFLILAFLAANMPFFSKKIFFIIKTDKRKHFLFELSECLVYYGLSASLAYFMEVQTSGSAHNQDFVFYVITFALFLVFAFPGFVFSHFWRVKRSR